MSTWPEALAPAASTLHTVSWEALGAAFQLCAGGPASIAWPAANRALFIPFVLGQPLTVQRMFVLNGATASGNWDAGVYDAGGVRRCSTGATAQAGTSAVQSAAVTTPALLAPGAYYLALLLDGTTGTVHRWVASSTAGVHYGLGMREQAVGAGTLPATATFASSISTAYIPSFGLTERTSL